MMNKRMDGSVQVLRPQAIPISQRDVYRKYSHERRDGRGSGSSWAASSQEGLGRLGYKDGVERISSSQLGGVQRVAGGSLFSSANSLEGVPAAIALARCHRHNLRRIFVQAETGEVVVVEVDCASGGAEKVKRSVQAALNVPTEQADLIFGGQVLDDLHELQNDVPVLLRRGMTRSASSPCLAPTSLPSHLPASSSTAAGTPGPRSSSLFPAWVVTEDPSSGLLSPAPSLADTGALFEVVGGLRPPAHLQQLIEDAERGALSGAEPVAALGGLGGAYYFHSSAGEKVVIVKPTDEEPFAPNNPNGYVGRSLGQPGLKKAIRVGEAGIREVAAYLLDHNGFAGVPYTALVRAAHPIFNVNSSSVGVPTAAEVRGSRSGVGREIAQFRLASSSFRSALSSRTGGGTPGATAASAAPSKLCSLQQYVHHDYDTSECGTSRFPVSAVHRIGILDIRVFNTDRHSGNILVRKLGQDMFERRHVNPVFRVDEAVELVPIDHGFCLPETLEAAYFEWLHWPQASLPFSDNELDYISSLDVHAEVAMLRERLPMLREGCLRVLVLSTTLLQKGAAAGLTLADIGSIMSREVRGTEEVASELEVLCLEAMKVVNAPSSSEVSKAGLAKEFAVVADVDEVGGLRSPWAERGWDVLDHPSPRPHAAMLRQACTSPPLPEDATLEDGGMDSPGLMFGFDDGASVGSDDGYGPPVPEGKGLQLSSFSNFTVSECSPSPARTPKASAGRPFRGSKVAVCLDFNGGASALRASALSNSLRIGTTPLPHGAVEGATPVASSSPTGTPSSRRKLPSRHESFALKRSSQQSGPYQQCRSPAQLSGLKLGSAGVAGSRLKTLMVSHQVEEAMDGALPGGASFLLSDMESSKWERFYEVFEDLVEELVVRKAKERGGRPDFFGTSCQW